MGRTRRGRILRDTAAGDGLVFVDGKQYLFRLEGMWKSEFAPKVNMLVDVEFDDRGLLATLRTAPVEAVAQEQTAQALRAAKATTRTVARDVRTDALPALAQHAQAIGYPTLAALAALLLGWFYFSVTSMDMGAGGRIALSFYQALKLLNVRGIQDLVGGGSAGLYGLLCFLCCGAVLLPWLWRDRRAYFSMLAPLVFMVFAGLLLRHKFQVQMSSFEQAASQFGSLGDAHGRQFAAQFANQVATQVRNSIRLDFGAWLSLAAGLYLAWHGTRRALQDGDEVSSDSDDAAEATSKFVPETNGRPVPRVTPSEPMAAARDYFDSGSGPPPSPSR